MRIDAVRYVEARMAQSRTFLAGPNSTVYCADMRVYAIVIVEVSELPDCCVMEMECRLVRQWPAKWKPLRPEMGEWI